MNIATSNNPMLFMSIRKRSEDKFATCLLLSPNEPMFLCIPFINISNAFVCTGLTYMCVMHEHNINKPLHYKYINRSVRMALTH